MYSKPYAKIGNFINFQYFFTNTFFKLQEVKKAVCPLCTTAGAITVGLTQLSGSLQSQILCVHILSALYSADDICVDPT